MKRNLFWAIALLFFGTTGFASQGLVIHSAEFGVGKFHRQDNKVHPYPQNSSWAPYILPDNAPTDKPLIKTNADGSISIFYSTLDDLLASVMRVVQVRKAPVSVLNVHGHGLPGAMWFPATDKDLKSGACSSWVGAASGSDEENYSQYYSAVSPDEIRAIRAMSNSTSIHMGCTTGLKQWQAEVAKVPQFKQVFAPDAQVHFLSCVVGLGNAGQAFTQGVADLLLSQGQGRVETSTNFGLGDWSMPEGMGFWDLLTDNQVEHDNDVYTKDRKDREIAQKGVIRRVTFGARGWQSSLIGNQNFMSLGFSTRTLGAELVLEEPVSTDVELGLMPTELRIPGTRAYVKAEF